MVIAVGTDAPDFTLMGAGFKTTTLSEIKGKKVLAFFPASFSGNETDGCQCQLKGLKDLAKMDGVTVLGISKDHPFVQGAWEKDHQWGFSCLSDLDLAVSKNYVGTMDLGAFLDDLKISTNFGPYEASARGCVVIGEDNVVKYAWVGLKDGAMHPGILPNVAEIEKAVKAA